MRLVTYEIERKVKLGVVSQDEKWIYPLQSLGMDYTTMQEVIEHISDSELQLLEHASGLENSRIDGAAPWSEVKMCIRDRDEFVHGFCKGEPGADDVGGEGDS